MNAKVRYREKVRERICVSREREAAGAPPDPWVTEHLAKTKARRRTYLPRQREQKRARRLDTPHRRRRTYLASLPPEERAAAVKARQAAWFSANGKRPYAARKRRPEAVLATRFRIRLHKMLRRADAVRCRGSMDLLGCDLATFRSHIESKFVLGMSWANYGEWHLDHIRPCASFDLLEAAQQQACFHFSNFQPLWAADNRAKVARVLGSHAP